MPTLNRFPLLGLWAKEAARRVGYKVSEAEALGHAYAVLYAIRAQRLRHPKTEAEEKAIPRRKRGEQLRLFGDDLEVTHDAKGRLVGLVGGEKPQTAESYQASVADEYPAGYYDRLERAFQQMFKSIAPAELDSRVAYDLYDEWKKSCGVGRLVDLDELLKWLRTYAAKYGPRKSSRQSRKRS
jgi:hypothetical protein